VPDIEEADVFSGEIVEAADRLTQAGFQDFD